MKSQVEYFSVTESYSLAKVCETAKSLELKVRLPGKSKNHFVDKLNF